jgi:hypothetical protein
MCVQSAFRSRRTRLLARAQVIGWVRWNSIVTDQAVQPLGFRCVMTPPAISIFVGIAQAWKMNFRKQARLLGLPWPLWIRCVRGHVTGYYALD